MNVDGGYRVEGMEMAVTAHSNQGFTSDETDAALVSTSSKSQELPFCISVYNLKASVNNISHVYPM